MTRQKFERAVRRMLPASAVRALQAVRRHWQSGITSNYRVLNSLDVFYPSSANFWAFPEVTISSANTLPAKLLQLLETVAEGESGQVDEVAAPWVEPSPRARELQELFDRHGSDKGSSNGYHSVYAAILSEVSALPEQRVLEIGIGTTDPGALSSMGRDGRPGASLRAFRDFLPDARIHGADIDERILFREERIRTARVDQLDPSSFARMSEALGCDGFDLIIDDGLHSVEANLNTLMFALGALRPRGWIVIEDIPERTAGVWQLIEHLLVERGRRSYLVRCRQASLFVVQQS